MTKEKNLNFKTTEKEAKEFMEISKIIDIPFSQLARQAIRKEIAELKRTDLRLQDNEIPQAT